MPRQTVLGSLGIAADEEHVYRTLLTNPGASTTELREHTALSYRRLRHALAELERKAMIARRGGATARFQPAPPDIAVEALISAREEELNRARLDARELTATLYTPPEQLRVADLVEILTTQEAVAQRWVQLQRVTRDRVQALVRPPFAQRGLDDDEAVQRSMLGRGIAMYGVYDEDAIRSAGTLEHIRRMSTMGEYARVVSRVPLKLAIFDRRVALVPLAQSDPGGSVDAGLVVRESALLDALVALFDTFWQRGVEVRPGDDAPAPRRPAADEDTVLTLLVGGLKDESIARQLGVSTHTVRRRIADLVNRLGVTTRFQAGYALGRQGWAEEHRDDRPR